MEEVTTLQLFQDELIVVQSQYSRFVADRMKGVLHQDQEIITQNKIVMALTQLIEEM